MSNILVTGGAGFIGSNFIKYMLTKYNDIEITNYDKLTYAGNLDNLDSIETLYKNYHFIKGDIIDYYKLKKNVKALKIDTIINFAAESHVDRSIENSDEFITTNINGTHTLLKLLHEFPIKKYIQISTDEVYGDREEGYFTEECSICGWNEERVTDNTICLNIDFLDGDSKNRALENMRLLCPNCYLSNNGHFHNSKLFCK